MHDLRRLQAFVATAEHGSFSAAADELGYAQSVVSHHVAALEREVGVVLVDRSVRPVVVTEAGRRLQAHARTILGHVGDAEADLRALAGLRSGSLRVGAFLAACVSFVPAAVSRFRAALPDVDVHLEQVRSDDALERLRAGALDLAVLWRVAGAEGDLGRGFDHEVLAREPYRIVLPAGHPLARRRRVELADLAGERFTVPRPAFGDGVRYAAWLRGLCAEAGFEPDCRYPVDDVSVGRAFVASGVCVGVMPQLSVAGAHAHGLAVRELPGQDASRSVMAVWRGARRVPAVAPMVARLRAATAELIAL